MDVTSVAHALSSETRVRLLALLHQQPMTSSDAFDVYQATFDSPKYRESIYRELENLVEAGLVEKRYESGEKRLMYVVEQDIVCFDLETSNVRMDTRGRE